MIRATTGRGTPKAFLNLTEWLLTAGSAEIAGEAEQQSTCSMKTRIWIT